MTGRHTDHGSVNGKMHSSKLSTKEAQLLGQVKDNIDHIHCEYLTSVCVCAMCIGSLIKTPNHVCLSNTEILSSIKYCELYLMLEIINWSKDEHFCCFQYCQFLDLWLKCRKSLNVILVWLFHYCALKNKRSLIELFSKYHYDHL